MVGKKKTKNPKEYSQSIIGSVISASKSSNNLTARILKRVYHLLLIFPRLHNSPFSTDLRYLSQLLFDHLQSRFNEFHSCLLNSSKEISNTSLEELTLLLRCCFVAFDSLGDEQEDRRDYGRILLQLLGKIVPIESGHPSGDNFPKFRSNRLEDEATVSNCSSFTIPFSSFAYFLPILEVFADELLMNTETRKLFLLVDSISDSDPLFPQNYSFASIACVLLIINSHFFLSHSLLQSPKSSPSFPSNLSLESALTLLSNPVICSSPKPYLSHLISLTSDSIPDTQFTNSAFIAYETSLKLYSSQINSIQINNPKFSSSNNLFESLLLPSYNFLPHLTPNPEKIKDFPAITRVRMSLEFLKSSSSVPVLHDRDISSFLTRITDESSSKSETVKITIGEQDGLILASIMKLIFSSILHFTNFSCLEKIRILTRSSDSAQSVVTYSHETLTNADPPRGSEFRCLLLHFSSFLPLCYASKIESLVENCLRVVAVLCHVVVIDDEGPRGLRSLPSYDNSTLESARKIHAKFTKVRSRVKEEEREACKGDAYLKCVVGNGAETLADYDELAEFIECAADKNYSSWIQDLGRFRVWRHRKMKYWGTQKKRKLWDTICKSQPLLKQLHYHLN